MTRFLLILPVLFALGCQGSSSATKSSTPPTVPVQQGEVEPVKPKAPEKPAKEPEKEKPKGKKYPLSQVAFKAGVIGLTRDQITAKYGEPDDYREDTVGWDGPYSVYKGPFTGMKGEKKLAIIYFKRTTRGSTADLIDFDD